jgi:hypothetical protein
MILSEGLMNSEVSQNQPEELTEQVSSEVDLDQQVQLTENEDSCGFPSHVNEDDDKLKNFTIREDDLGILIMIGGIEIFLPLSQEEAEIWVADATNIEEEQPVPTVKEEELEKISEAAQEGEDDENSEEWLNIFSQETEKTATWEFAAEE